MAAAVLSLATNNEITALKKVAEYLSQFSEVLRIVVFGSRVRGDFGELSDMDVLIIISNSNVAVKNKLISVLHDIELEFDVPISPVIFTKREYEVNKRLGGSFIENVEKEGIVLHDSERKG